MTYTQKICATLRRKEDKPNEFYLYSYFHPSKDSEELETRLMECPEMPQLKSNEYPEYYFDNETNSIKIEVKQYPPSPQEILENENKKLMEDILRLQENPVIPELNEIEKSASNDNPYAKEDIDLGGKDNPELSIDDLINDGEGIEDLSSSDLDLKDLI